MKWLLYMYSVLISVYGMCLYHCTIKYDVSGSVLYVIMLDKMGLGSSYVWTMPIFSDYTFPFEIVNISKAQMLVELFTSL